MVAAAAGIKQSLTRMFSGAAWVPRDRWVYVAMIACAVLIRLPFFFYSSEGRIWRYEMLLHDEALFILQGRDVLQGFLPYTQHWDNRPPFGWFLYAIINFLTQENLVAFRILGALCIGTTACILYKLCSQYRAYRTGIFAGICYSIYSSTAQAGQIFSYEHVGALPFALMLYYLLGGHIYRYHRLRIAALYTMCSLTLTNFIVLGPAIALLLPVKDKVSGEWQIWPRFSWLQAFKQRDLLLQLLINGMLTLSVLLGGIIGIYLLYWVNDLHELLIHSVIDIPMKISGHRVESEYLLSYLLTRGKDFIVIFISSYIYSPEWLVPFLGAIFTLHAISVIFAPEDKRDLFAVRVCLLAVFCLLMLFVRGGGNWSFPYYMMQIMPVVALMMGSAFMLRMADLRLFVMLVSVYGLYDASAYVLSWYKPLYSYVRGDESASYSFLDDRLYQVARELNQFPIAGQPMYVCTKDDMLYVLTHTADPDYFIFQTFNHYGFVSNILNMEVEPFDKMMERTKPVAIIGLKDDHRCFRSIRWLLNKGYRLHKEVAEMDIYLRNDIQAIRPRLKLSH